MTQDIGFWTWPVDRAVGQSKAGGWAWISTLLYCLGAALLLPRASVSAGLVLVVLGVAASVFALGKVVVTRSRLAGTH